MSIKELLGKALKELVAAMPYVAGKRVISTDEQGDPVYEDVGPTSRFMALPAGTTRRSRAVPATRPGGAHGLSPPVRRPANLHCVPARRRAANAHADTRPYALL